MRGCLLVESRFVVQDSAGGKFDSVVGVVLLPTAFHERQ